MGITLVCHYKPVIPRGKGQDVTGTFKVNYLDVEGEKETLCERGVSHAENGGKSILSRGNSKCKAYGPEKQANVFSAGLGRQCSTVQMWPVSQEWFSCF